MGNRPSAASPRETVRAFEAKLRKGWERCGLGGGRGPLSVGVSGGGDSTVLLLSAASLLEASGKAPKTSLLALHIDHGLRPEGAERDAAHAERLCKEREIPFRRLRVRVEGAEDVGLEAAARRARRAAYLAAAREAGAGAVALGHTQDDQVETVLMRLFEGSGLHGLSGIRPVSPLGPAAEGGGPEAEGEGQIVLLRPLLGVTRAEARAYLAALGVEWVEDETNEDERRLRNLFRRRVRPALEEALGAGAGARVAASAAHLAAALEVLDEAVREAERSYLSEEGGEVRVAPLPAVAALPQAVRAGLWRAALDRAGGAPRGRKPLERLIEGMDRLAREGGPAARLDLPGGLEARRAYAALAVGPPRPARQVTEEAVPLRIPGRTVHPSLGLAVEARLHEREGGKGGKGGDPPGTDGMSAWLDVDLLGEGAVLRRRRAGDRFRPGRGRKDRKLKDFFIDRKIPRGERDAIPLIAVGGEVGWVIGHSVSASFRAKRGARRKVLLRAAPLAGEPEPPAGEDAPPRNRPLDGRADS